MTHVAEDELLAAALHLLQVASPGASQAEQQAFARLREACRALARATRTRRFYVTQNAVDNYCRLRGWAVDSVELWSKAEAELLDLAIDARPDKRDRHGREVWKSPKRTGRGLRWVIDTRPHPGGELPRAIWVGQGRPPDRYFEHPGEAISGG